MKKKEFQNEDLQTIYDDVFADGVITEEEVKEVYSLRNDFEGDDEYDDLLIAIVSGYALSDGVFSEEEGQFLIDLILADDTIDGTESTLIENIIEECEFKEIECPANFQTAFESYFSEDTYDDEEDDEECGIK